jgi:hypothetical protein
LGIYCSFLTVSHAPVGRKVHTEGARAPENLGRSVTCGVGAGDRREACATCPLQILLCTALSQTGVMALQS